VALNINLILAGIWPEAGIRVIDIVVVQIARRVDIEHIGIPIIIIIRRGKRPTS